MLHNAVNISMEIITYRTAVLYVTTHVKPSDLDSHSIMLEVIPVAPIIVLLASLKTVKTSALCVDQYNEMADQLRIIVNKPQLEQHVGERSKAFCRWTTRSESLE
jgi:hypothetical protein